MHSMLRGKHFITDQEWTREELEMVFDTADELKRDFALGRPHRYLPDKTLFMIFFDNSTRTRNSFEAGMTQLGGHAHDLTPDKLQISRYGLAPLHMVLCAATVTLCPVLHWGDNDSAVQSRRT